jgi:hypothetical protein
MIVLMASNTIWPHREPDSICHCIHQFTSEFVFKGEARPFKSFNFYGKWNQGRPKRFLCIVPVHPATASINFSPWGYGPMKKNIFTTRSNSLSHHLRRFEISSHSSSRPMQLLQIEPVSKCPAKWKLGPCKRLLTWTQSLYKSIWFCSSWSNGT